MGSHLSLIDEATIQIIDMIQQEHLMPGHRLPNEKELAAHLNIGRGTLREAVRQLVTRNVLVVRQGSGTYISDQMGVPEDPLGITFIEKGPHLAKDLAELRLMIEPEIAATTARVISEAQMKNLRTLYTALRKRLDSGEDYVGADAQFHCYIAECSGNSVLQNLMPTIISAVNLSIKESQDYFRKDSALEHQRILDAICRKDPVGARYAMISHLNISREYFAQKLSQAPSVRNGALPGND